MKRFLQFIGGVYLAVSVLIVGIELAQRWLDTRLDAGLKQPWEG